MMESLESRQFLSVSYPTLGTAYTQNFDAASAGTLPAGWLANKTPGGTSSAPFTGTPGAAVTPTTYGGTNSGGFYYYGGAEKALGSTGSNSFGGVVYGVNLTNTTGQSITQVTVAVDFEVYRNDGGGSQVVTGGYRVGGSDDLTGSYTNVPALNSSFAGGSPGATQAKNVTFTLATPWGPGEVLSIRFDDPNNPSNDDAIAVDNFSINAPVVNTATTTTITSISPAPATSGQTVTFNASVTPNSGSSVPTGTVSFVTDSGTGTVLATGPVNGSGNVSATATPAAGTYSDIVAVYSPTGSFGGSTSSPFGSPLVVNFAAIPFDGTTYTQDFSNLPASSASAGFTTPIEINGVAGWSYVKSGGSASGNSLGYFVNNGASSTGGVYSYGASLDPDRALGLVASSTNAGRIGAKFANTSGSTVDNLTISLDAETWRSGDQPTGNTIVFEYLLGGLDINDSNFWTPVSALDLIRTGSVGGSGGSASDGNVNKTGLSASLTGLGWTAGQTLTIRWTDSDNSGSDDGMAVDNFSLALTPTNAAGTFNVSAAATRVLENGQVSILVNRTGGTSGPADVSYTLADISTASDDYTAPGGTVHFDDGQEQATILIQTTDDAADELAEKFSITLTGVSNTTGTGAAIGSNAVATVTIADTDGHVLTGGSFTQDWTNTDDAITSADGWDNVSNITGFGDGAGRDANNPSVIADLGSTTGSSSGGVAEFDGLSDPTVALQPTAAIAEPQLVIDLNTTGVTEASIEFDARDLDATPDNVDQQITLQYRIGNSGPFVDVPGYTPFDATTGPSLADLVTHVTADLPNDALGQALVQIKIATNRVGGSNEWVGIDNIEVTASPTVGTPAWLDPSSIATWDPGTSTLTVTGAATIVADPGADEPTINASGAAAILTISPTTGTAVHIGGLNLSGGASATFTANGSRVLVVENATFNIDASSKLDLADNDLIVRGGASLAAVEALIASARTAEFNWSGNGLTSSAAVGGPFAGATGLATILNDDGSGNAYHAEFDGVTGLTAADVIVKYTWYGDADLSGLVDDFDFALLDAGFTGAGTGNFFGDLDGSGAVDDFDFALLDAGFTSGGNTTQL